MKLIGSSAVGHLSDLGPRWAWRPRSLLAAVDRHPRSDVGGVMTAPGGGGGY